MSWGGRVAVEPVFADSEGGGSEPLGTSPAVPHLADYQKNLALICPMRGSRALVTIPKLESLMLPEGLVN